MLKAENDLHKAREDKERQAKESMLQVERLKCDHRKQLEKQSQELEREAIKLRQELEAEKLKTTKKSEQACQDLHNEYQTQLAQTNQRHKTTVESLTKVCCCCRLTFFSSVSSCFFILKG